MSEGRERPKVEKISGMSLNPSEAHDFICIKHKDYEKAESYTTALEKERDDLQKKLEEAEELLHLLIGQDGIKDGHGHLQIAVEDYLKERSK